MITDGIYIVIAQKTVQPSQHGYLVGAFTKKSKAIKCADAEDARRGGKYGCIAYETILDPDDLQQADMSKHEIHRSKSLPKK